MNGPAVRAILWLHTLAMGGAGLLFFLLPQQGAAFWPWTLPPLAARFMASLFLGGAVCSLVFLRQRDGRARSVLVLLALGDLLVALSGLLGIREIGPGAATLRFVAFFSVFSLLLAVAALAMKHEMAGAGQSRVPPALRAFFLIHLLVVLPVGVSMFFLPAWAQPLWPWRMTPINVRLIGSFFFGAAFISAWALRQANVRALVAVLALYAAFATAATLASLLHLALFDPARPVTWAFFALYVFVAAGSTLFLLQLTRNRNRAAAAA
ncbi:MAG TPA: hypothetical protein VMG60_02040 [Burkholderiaceae bacterium]|nr:hypothetical protein [Burkholderiaceae bacterium]